MNNNKTIKTKFGNASIDNYGYWVITSRKEGNFNKKLHRLIYEEEYGEIPEGYVIHHLNSIKTDNRIENLQCIKRGLHSSLHNKGENNPFYDKKHSRESRKIMSENHADFSGENHPMYDKHHTGEICKKISKKQNTTGYYRVIQQKNKNYKQGFIWRYQYYENRKRKNICSVDIDKLKEKVLAKGLIWMKIKGDKYEI